MPNPEISQQLNEPLSVQERQRISTFYALSLSDQWKRNSRGLVNVNYEIGNAFFLALHGRKTQDQLEACAEIANNMQIFIPVARPVKGKCQTGYTLQTDTKKHTLLTPRLLGKHYVDIAHTQKEPIPLDLHKSLATFYWQFQDELSTTSKELKDRLKAPGVMRIEDWKDRIPEIAAPLKKYSPEEFPPFKYFDLVHDDLERQNILSVGNKVTGIVDLDSIRMGDVLYEYGHFLFNNVLCDPSVDSSILSIYITELCNARRIKPEDRSSLYNHIYQYAISDIIDFNDLKSNLTLPQHKMIDMDLLVQQYERALSVASDFFNNGHFY
ncbi:MAG: aminoglycoside phosphotransferase family protein [bacterium]|nr:aminoglycoside phosphotransferase family protein [bacterium]